MLQEIFIQVWEEADRYSPKAGNHSAGWSRSRGVVPSTDCDDVRHIVVHGNAMKSAWFRNLRLRVAMQLEHWC